MNDDTLATPDDRVRYVAEKLRQAKKHGYEEGYQAGWFAGLKQRRADSHRAGMWVGFGFASVFNIIGWLVFIILTG